jgi:hypothetical protein
MYHSILEMHEEDRVFIDCEGVILEREQIDILRRISHLNPWIKRLGWASGALLLLMVSLWIYQGLFGPMAM